MARGEKIASSKVTILSKEKQPFPVPENWFWTDIDSINQYSGLSIDPMKQPDTTFELYSVPSSADDYPEIITGSEIGSVKQSVIKNDVLLCKINPRINRVWKISQYTDNELMASSEWIIIRNSVINPDYLMFCFRTQYFREFMLSNVSGVGGSLMRAQPKFVKKYPIPIAPITEQQRIVDRIESLFAKLDEAKEKTQAVVDGFELRKSAILHKAFTGELTERWRKEHGVGLDSWKTKTSKELFDYVTSGSRGWAQYYSETGAVFVRMGNLDHGTIELDFSDVQHVRLPDKAEGQRSRLQKNDILISITADVGMVGLVREMNFEAYINQHIALARPNDENNSEFIAWYLVSDVGLRQMQGKQRGATKVGLGLDDIRSLQLSMPKIAEQKEVVSILNELMNKEQQAKEAAEAVLSQIDAMKKAILARAFRGELGTNDPAEEWAGTLVELI